MVSLQIIVPATQTVDCSILNSAQVKNIPIRINEENYPNELINLDIMNGNYVIA